MRKYRRCSYYDILAPTSAATLYVCAGGCVSVSVVCAYGRGTSIIALLFVGCMDGGHAKLLIRQAGRRGGEGLV